VKLIKSRPAIAKRAATGELIVLGAFYENRSGMVDFIRGENDEVPNNHGHCGSGSPNAEEEIVICGAPRR
jgi:hypothetical protein